MKIAVITEDETTISQHFGRAPLYVVVTVEDGEIVSKETRSKAAHGMFGAHRAEPATGERHGYDTGSQRRHTAMMDTIGDCDVLFAGGMGWGAYESLKNGNIQPVITDVINIDEAVKLYLEDKLPNLMERLH